MTEQASSDITSPPPPTELPLVDPPSARFIMQLFVIPFIVVVVLVCLLLVVYGLFGRLATSGQDALGYVQEIRSENENRRWRAAYELASLIYNEPKLANDPALLGELATLLQTELAKPRTPKTSEVARYLALAIGSFQSLDATKAGRPVDTLAILADALQENVAPEVRIAAAQSLSRLAARGDSLIDQSQTPLVRALAAALKTDNADVRQNVAYALGFFDTPDSHAALAEAARDSNRYARYNVSVALARLDDPAATDLLREMLSTSDLLAAIRSENPERAGEAAGRVEAIQLETLLALQAAYQAGKTRILGEMAPFIQELTRPPAARSVQVEAADLLKKMQSLTAK